MTRAQLDQLDHDVADEVFAFATYATDHIREPGVRQSVLADHIIALTLWRMFLMAGMGVRLVLAPDGEHTIHLRTAHCWAILRIHALLGITEQTHVLLREEPVPPDGYIVASYLPPLLSFPSNRRARIRIGGWLSPRSSTWMANRLVDERGVEHVLLPLSSLEPLSSLYTMRRGPGGRSNSEIVDSRP